LQTEDLPGLDRLPVALTKTGVVSQFAKFTTTDREMKEEKPTEFCNRQELLITNIWFEQEKRRENIHLESIRRW